MTSRAKDLDSVRSALDLRYRSLSSASSGCSRTASVLAVDGRLRLFSIIVHSSHAFFLNPRPFRRARRKIRVVILIFAAILGADHYA